MCGIAGFIDLKAATGPDTLGATALAMANTLTHRGPDASDVWCDADAGLALAHTRLAIIDLSAAGAQPMKSANGRFVIAYNGEIYNADELRHALGNDGFRGHSDTEVVVEACARWGVKEAVNKLMGMFAFALWDSETRTLSLVCDRMGIKPLYWGSRSGSGGEHFFFASELKALMAHSAFERNVDIDALASYLRFSVVPGPHSIFQGVQKLQPGTILTLRPDTEPRVETYWSLRDVATAGQANPGTLSDTEAEDELDRLILDATHRRMVSDVPLGAFLSGGIDSSAVVAAMQVESSKPVHTFTIAMDEDGYNEAEYARAIAEHLGTEHTELTITPDDARDVIPDLARYYDEPFADSSQIPTYLVSKLARSHVTVALSGDGGDELFAGYERHHWAEKLGHTIGAIPKPLRKLGAGVLGLLALNPDTPLGIKAKKAHDILSLKNETDLYRRQLTVWEQPGELVPGGNEYAGLPWDRTLESDIPDLLTRTQVVDALTYLPYDILTKVDRASMAVSLEARVPLLDHRIVEFAFGLPKNQRKRNGESKWLLKNVLARRVPRELFERPKMGFGIPIGQWLRGPLKDWAEDLLGEDALNDGGLLNPAPIRAVWAEHLKGKPGLQDHLWTVLMFQAWHQEWMEQ